MCPSSSSIFQFPRPLRIMFTLLRSPVYVLCYIRLHGWIYLSISVAVLLLFLRFVFIWSSAKAAGVCISLSVWYVGCEILVPAIRYCEYNISPFFFVRGRHPQCCNLNEEWKRLFTFHKWPCAHIKMSQGSHGQGSTQGPFHLSDRNNSIGIEPSVPYAWTYNITQ